MVKQKKHLPPHLENIGEILICPYRYSARKIEKYNKNYGDKPC